MSAFNAVPAAGDPLRPAAPVADYVSDWQLFPETNGGPAPPASDAGPDASALPDHPE